MIRQLYHLAYNVGKRHEHARSHGSRLTALTIASPISPPAIGHQDDGL